VSLGRQVSPLSKVEKRRYVEAALAPDQIAGIELPDLTAHQRLVAADHPAALVQEERPCVVDVPEHQTALALRMPPEEAATDQVPGAGEASQVENRDRYVDLRHQPVAVGEPPGAETFGVKLDVG